MAEAYFVIHHRLDTDPLYANLSVMAKYLYGKMRDILKLSIKNNWQDENGFYIRLTRLNMATLLKCCLPTVRKVIKELINVGLLKEKREGLTRSNRLYVQLLTGENETEFQCKARKNVLSEKKPDFSTEGNAVSPNHRNPNERNLAQREDILAGANILKNPPTAQDIKENRFWVLKEGAIFHEQGEWWIYENGEVMPYKFGKKLAQGAVELLSQLGMPPNDIISSLKAV